MKTFFHLALCFLLAAALRADDAVPVSSVLSGGESVDSFGVLLNAQPKLLRLSATVDGSGRIIFTRQAVRYEHKQWGQPTNVIFGGEPWLDVTHTPPSWLEAAAHLDLTKAWIVKRKGRDMIAIERTPDSFDLYLCDSPNGSAPYEVTIAIPRRH